MENKMLNRKRKNSFQISSDKSKMRKNAEIKSSKIKLNIPKHFMAKLTKENKNKIKNTINEKNNEIIEIMKGDDIIFERRKQKAQKIFEEIDKLDINDINNYEVIKNKINKALEYDNIKKENIYRSIKYFFKMEDKINYENTLNKAKYCLTKKCDLIQNIDNNNIVENIDLSKEIKIPEEFVMFEDEADLIEEIKNTLESLESIYEGIDEVVSESVKKTDILRTKLMKTNNNLFTIERKNSTDKKLNKIYDDIYNFLYYFMFINDLQYYGENQPIDYGYSSTIYLINIFNRIYLNTTKLIKWRNSQFVKIDENRMKKLYLLKEYKNHLFELIKNNNNKINKEIEDKLDTFFYYLESEYFPDNLKDIMNESLKMNVPLNLEIIKKFVADNTDNNKKYKYDDETLSLTYEHKEYKYKYKCYNKNLLDVLANIKSTQLIEEQKWNNCSMIRYFDEDDISFLKALIKKILKSKLFKELYSNYSNVNYVDYYFNYENNIDDLLNRIKFIYFMEKNTGRQGGTIPKHLKIITSSICISNIKDKKDYINYKLLELGRKLIIILHEIVHFLKRALNLITNGNIMRTTIENEKDDSDIIESGRFFEEIVFNLENNYARKRVKSTKHKKGIKEEEEKDWIRYLNIKKTLKILDSNSYNKNINDFKKYCGAEKEKEFESMDEDLKEYLKKINFDIDNYYQNKQSYENYKIICSRKGVTGYFIEYISDNHNYQYQLYQSKVNFFHN